MSVNEKKQKCLRIIWDAIGAARPNQSEIVLYVRAEDAALMVECLNIPQVQEAFEAKDLSFVVKETMSEQFDIRQQANATFYALFVAASLLSEKTARSAPKWLSMLMTHAHRQMELNGVNVAQAISRIIPVELEDEDELTYELQKHFNEESLHKSFAETASSPKRILSVRELIEIHDKLLKHSEEVMITCSLASGASLALLLESSLGKIDDSSGGHSKAIKTLCDGLKRDIVKRVPEAAELFTTTNIEE